MEDVEIWKDIPGYEGFYKISNTGKIKKLRYIMGVYVGEKIMISHFSKGLLRTSLTHHHKRRTVSIHLLVAKLFIPNPLNLKYVIHVDGDRSNNHVENLRWSASKTIVSDLPKKKMKKPTKASNIIKALKSLITAFSNTSKQEYSDYHVEIEALLEELLQQKNNIDNEYKLLCPYPTFQEKEEGAD